MMNHYWLDQKRENPISFHANKSNSRGSPSTIQNVIFEFYNNLVCRILLYNLHCKGCTMKCRLFCSSKQTKKLKSTKISYRKIRFILHNSYNIYNIKILKEEKEIRYHWSLPGYQLLYLLAYIIKKKN